MVFYIIFVILTDDASNGLYSDPEPYLPNNPYTSEVYSGCSYNKGKGIVTSCSGNYMYVYPHFCRFFQQFSTYAVIQQFRTKVMVAWSKRIQKKKCLKVDLSI